MFDLRLNYGKIKAKEYSNGEYLVALQIIKNRKLKIINLRKAFLLKRKIGT